MNYKEAAIQQHNVGNRKIAIQERNNRMAIAYKELISRGATPWRAVNIIAEDEELTEIRHKHRNLDPNSVRRVLVKLGEYPEPQK